MSIFNSGAGGASGGAGGDILSKVIESRNETVSCISDENIPDNTLVSISNDSSTSKRFIVSDNLYYGSSNNFKLIKVGDTYVIIYYSGYYSPKISCFTIGEDGYVLERSDILVSTLVPSSTPLTSSNTVISEIDDSRFLLVWKTGGSSSYKVLARIINVNGTTLTAVNNQIYLRGSSNSGESTSFTISADTLNSSLVAVFIEGKIDLVKINGNSLTSSTVYTISSNTIGDWNRLKFIDSSNIVCVYCQSSTAYAYILKLTYNESTGNYSALGKSVSGFSVSLANNYYISLPPELCKVGNLVYLTYATFTSSSGTYTTTYYIWKFTNYDTTPTNKSFSSTSVTLNYSHSFFNTFNLYDDYFIILIGSVAYLQTTNLFKYYILNSLPSTFKYSSFKNFLLDRASIITDGSNTYASKLERIVPFDSTSCLFFYVVDNKLVVRRVGFSGTNITNFMDAKTFSGLKATPNQLVSGERVGYVESGVTWGNDTDVPVICRMP